MPAAIDSNPPADEADIAALVARSPAPLPAGYLDFLRATDGGHAQLATYVRLWPAHTVIDYNRDYEIQRWVPGLVGFGDDGGPVFVAFDTRSGSPYPVVTVPFAPMEFAEVEAVAGSFAEFVGQSPNHGSVAAPATTPGPLDHGAVRSSSLGRGPVHFTIARGTTDAHDRTRPARPHLVRGRTPPLATRAAGHRPRRRR